MFANTGWHCTILHNRMCVVKERELVGMLPRCSEYKSEGTV